MKRIISIIGIIGTTSVGCAANDASQETGSPLERTLEISYFEMEPDCIRGYRNENVEYDGSAYCTLDDSILMTIQLAYSGTGDEINSALLDEYHDEVLARSFSLSRDISADPYRFQGDWTTVSDDATMCCPDTTGDLCNSSLVTLEYSIFLTAEITYLASKTEEFDLNKILIYPINCAEYE